jgi:murein DD-endopeptidase MepM/ murein hydrolase activator NlpD
MKPLNRLYTSKRLHWWLPGALFLAALVVVAWLFLPTFLTRQYRLPRLRTWFQQPASHPDWQIRAGDRCAQAPFIMPTDGYIGFLWGDSFRPFHRHQGLDIFGGEQVGITPVIAAYPGYLTRQADWKSTVIVRVPEDPLQPGRQIWLYYTHMADAQGNSFISEDFPPGTVEKYVNAGDLLGYQGNFSGDPNAPTGVHLHFSIVRDDGQGKYMNELKTENTLDPSPYLGMSLNAAHNPSGLATCQPNAGR